MVGLCDLAPHSKPDAVQQAAPLHRQPRTRSRMGGFCLPPEDCTEAACLSAPEVQLKSSPHAVWPGTEDAAETADLSS